MKEYLAWNAFRNAGLGVLFVFGASFLEKDNYTSQLFSVVPMWLWVTLMAGVAVLSGAAIVKSSMLLARFAFTGSMGVALMLVGDIVAVGVLEDEVAPFLTLFLVTYVGKDFAMARMPVISVAPEDINLRKGDG